MAKKKEKSLDSIKKMAIGMIDTRHTDNDGLLVRRDRKVTMLDLFGGSEQKAAVAYFVSDLLAKGFNNQQIVEAVNNKYELGWKTRHVTIVKELLHKLWRCEIAHTMNDQIAREVASIDTQLKETWAAWEFSKKGIKHKKTRSEKKEGDKSLEGSYDLTEVICDEDTTAGDVKFLQHINDLGKERRKLLGLYAPEKKDIKGGPQAVQFNLIGEGAGGEVINIIDSIMASAPQARVEEAVAVDVSQQQAETSTEPVFVGAGNAEYDIDEIMNDFMMG
jgi:hypothetical protein